MAVWAQGEELCHSATVQMGTRPEGRQSAPWGLWGPARIRRLPCPPPRPAPQHLRPHQLPLRLGAGEGGLPALVLQAVWRGGLQLLGPHQPAGGRRQAHLRLGSLPGRPREPAGAPPSRPRPPEVLPEPTSWGFLAPSRLASCSGLTLRGHKAPGSSPATRPDPG